MYEMCLALKVKFCVKPMLENDKTNFLPEFLSDYLSAELISACIREKSMFIQV